jgi:GNAT superfamily N-acetyltransferase
MATSTRARRGSAKKATPTRGKRTAKTKRAAKTKSARPVSTTAKAAPTSRAGKGRKLRSAPKKPSHPTVKRSTRKATSKSVGALVLARPSAAGPSWTEKLRDGSHVLIRPIRKSDAAIERAFIERMSPESRHFRFLGYFKSPSDEFVGRLTDIDYQRDMAFVALVHDEGEKKEIGVSRYSVAPDGTSCECAVAVADEWQGRGLGVLLMRHLIEVARARGIKKMLSMDASDNLHMRDLAEFLGFRRRPDPDDTRQVIYTLSL